jgi:hypothetical protein
LVAVIHERFVPKRRNSQEAAPCQFRLRGNGLTASFYPFYANFQSHVNAPLFQANAP